jgi:hypothetical protein
MITPAWEGELPGRRASSLPLTFPQHEGRPIMVLDDRRVQKPRPRALSSGYPTQGQSARGPLLPLPHHALACPHAAWKPPQRARQGRGDGRAPPSVRCAAPPGQAARAPTRRSWVPRGAEPSASPPVFFIELHTRQVRLAGVTRRPNGPWVVQRARELSMERTEGMTTPRFLIRDRDGKFTRSSMMCSPATPPGSS